MKKLNGTIIKIFAVLLSSCLLCCMPASLSILAPGSNTADILAANRSIKENP